MKTVVNKTVEDTPEIEATGRTIGDLFLEMSERGGDCEFWIRIQRNRFLVTPETFKAVMHGMHIALELSNP